MLLSQNPSAIQLLEKNPDKIDWYQLCYNRSEWAIHLLEQNQNLINNWLGLSFHRSEHPIQLFKKNPDKIYWYNLSQNPHLFTYDYIQMKQNCLIFKDDLMKNRFHPRNISKFKDWRINGFNTDFD